MRTNGLRNTLAIVLILAVVVVSGMRRAAAQLPDAKALITTMVNNEFAATTQEHHMEYLAVETSQRTGGHSWTEHVVETPLGRVRFLLAEDGKPLSPERTAQERGRLAGVIADPGAFEKSESAEKGEEGHARTMLQTLEHGFILENMRREGADWHIDFHPDPAYSPSGVEERVIHGMTGWIAIDAKDLRLHHVEARLPQNVSIGFGILATVRAGSHFATTKGIEGGQWRTTDAVNAIDGKAALFKSIAKNQEVARRNFRLVPDNLSLPAAVALAEQN